MAQLLVYVRPECEEPFGRGILEGSYRSRPERLGEVDP
jgi:hypothetical protein